MKTAKRALSLLLTGVLLCLLCACGGNASSTAETAQSAATEAPPTTAPDVIETTLRQMSVEEKVGQLFYARCPEENAESLIRDCHLGALLLFGRDFEGKTAEKIRTDIASYQSVSKLPLLIGVDEEGGTVVRVSDNPNLRDAPFDSPRNTYQGGGWDAVEAAEAEKADLLLSLGVNVNNAPVCDVTGNPDSFIYDRSFSGDAQEAAEYVRRAVTVCNGKKLGAVLKHFPGYGDNSDTHEADSYDSKSMEDFRAVDFVPFQAGIAAGAGAVMVSHNIVACMDGSNPASLSPEVHRVLREELGFAGVIVTDDLVMAAVSEDTDAAVAAVSAVKSGNDLLCCSEPETQYSAVLAAVKNGDISEARIDESVRRILKWKQSLGLLPPIQ